MGLDKLALRPTSPAPCRWCLRAPALDFELIDQVMDEHLAQLEQVWEDETGRGMVRPVPPFLEGVAERSRLLREGI